MTEKSYQEITREYDEMGEAGTELDSLVPVQARGSKRPRAVFSVRLSPNELAIISAAARKEGQTISDFIRARATAAVSGETAVHSIRGRLAFTGDLKEQLDRIEQKLDKLLDMDLAEHHG